MFQFFLREVNATVKGKDASITPYIGWYVVDFYVGK
jgi:hypothetical protein